ncbi:MAG: pyrroline-5-carboxylate reductase [Rhizobiaceae bacterium]
MMTKLILVGCGNMGYAMLAGWCGAGSVEASDVIVVEPFEPLRDRASVLGVTAVAVPAEIAPGTAAELVIFAVKPQMIGEVIDDYRRFADTGAAVVSIIAGTRIAFFEQRLGGNVPIIRCMPNTPAAIGRGMMVTVANAHVDAGTAATVADLLAASGEVATVENEDLMDAVTAVSGSGPAYVFHFIECLTAAGIDAGLPAGTAAMLAGQTVYGAASLARESDEEPGRLREQVTSPNGTTAAALAVLMGEDRLKTLVSEAVDAARKRSIELG